MIGWKKNLNSKRQLVANETCWCNYTSFDDFFIFYYFLWVFILFHMIVTAQKKMSSEKYTNEGKTIKPNFCYHKNG